MVELHKHQQDAVDKMHNGCVLYGGVGVGKSITAMAYFVSKVCGGTYGDYGTMRTPKDIVIITTAKKRDSLDWESEAIRFGITGNPQNSMDGIMLTVDSWNNIGDYENDKDKFFIFDEQRVVGYGAWSKAFIKIAKSNEFILLSATPGDTWLDYIPIFIANGFYKNKTDFINRHVVWTPRVKYPKVQRYLEAGVLVRRRNEILVHMPYVRKTKRHPESIVCDYDHILFDKVVKKKWHVYEERPLRDAGEMFNVMRKVVNSDSSRITALRELMEKHPRLIVFYNFNYELEMLRDLASSLTKLDGSAKTGQTPKQALPKSKEPSKSSRSGANDEQPAFPCQGHWTTDRGNGETLLTCEEWQTAVDGVQATSRSTKSRSTSTPTSTAGSPKSHSRDDSATRSQSRLSPSHTEKSSKSNSAKSLIDSGSGSSTTQSVSTASDECAKSQASVTGSTEPSGPRPSSTSFTTAEWNGQKHEQVPTTERWLYLVQYTAGAEGWNCVTTDAMVFFSQTYSYRAWWQAHGRTDRLNTPYTDLYYYYLTSDSLIDKAVSQALKNKKNFNERDLKVG